MQSLPGHHEQTFAIDEGDNSDNDVTARNS